MLSKSAARSFFLIGTVLCSGTFLLLTVDTIRKVPAQTNEQNLTPQVIHGKELWDKNNCMGCHTILGEGAYYAPELTKVYDRRGPAFIKAMIKDPQGMYPGERRMEEYDFTEEELDALVAFFKWIGEMDLNGWPPKPDLNQLAVPASQSATGGAVAQQIDRPQVFNQMCIACHALGGQGGAVGPALDGIGDRRSYDELVAWLRDPQAVKPGALMPKLPLSDTDVNELAAFLSKVTISGGAK
jgi:nitric oxide reductase subunit C